MPPKPQYNQAVASNQKKVEQESGWTKSTAMQKQQDAATKKSLDFNQAAGKVATNVNEAAEGLRDFIMKSIHDNNVLGLPDDEIKNVAKLLMQTPNKTEILDWTQTLMQPNSFAEEIIRQRDVAASRFAQQQKQQNNEDEDDDDGVASTAATTTASTSASTATARKKGGKGTRGKVVNLGKGGAGGDGDGVLVEGQFFECGCFAASHQFRSNCANCGRIFCMQESDEVCYSCQLPPQSCLAFDLRQALGRISDAADRKDRHGLEVALERRDQLLAFAKERAKRTSVIDDQSGTGRATALSAATDPWSSRADRDKAAAAGEDERRRVAEMHRRTGAVAVHLDIVNSCVQLGATPLTKEKQQEEANDDVEKEPVSMGLGFGNNNNNNNNNNKSKQDERTEQANVCAGISTTSLKKLPKPNQVNDGDNHDADDFFIDDNTNNNHNDDDGGDDHGARRVVALPSLMSKIFYCKTDEEAEEKTKIKATLKQSQNTGNLVVGRPAKHTTVTSEKDNQQQQHQPRKVDFRRPEDKKESVSGREIRVVENSSRRVQVDYFEGDNDTWLMAEQQDALFQNNNNGESNKLTSSSAISYSSKVARKYATEENSDDEDNEQNDYNENLSGGAIRSYQRNEHTRTDNIIENERLLHITMEDAANWKDNTANNNNNNNNKRKNTSANANDDEDYDNDGNSSSNKTALSAVDNSLLLAQQKAKKLFHKDEGWCLSMHQPWASLLVAGIKTHEGRTWPTEWRGRLWIHAAAAKPTQDSISEVEAHARQFVPEGAAFPTSYPTKCLLGCVALADCLDRDRYETTFPPVEQQLGDASTHCFLCMAPKALPFPLSMDGQHKIYKLDKKHWHAARKLFKEPLI